MARRRAGGRRGSTPRCASAPSLGRVLGVIDVEDALDDQLAAARLFLIHSTSFQFSAGSNCSLVHCASDLTFVHAFDVAGEVAEGLALALEDAPAPRPACWRCRRDWRGVIRGGTVMPLRMSRWRWPSTCRSTVSTSALHFALAARWINSLDEAAVAHDVELEPERFRYSRGNVLDRADRHGGEREGDAGGLRRAGGKNFAVAVLHAAQPDRRQRDRRRRRRADDVGGDVALVDIHQHALAQLDGREIVEVGAQRLLVIRAAVGIFEKGARNPAAGKLPQVFDAGDDFHGVTAALYDWPIG